MSLFLVAALGGCVTTAPRRYAQLAQAGRLYTAAFDTLARRAARVAVDTDGRQLMRARPDLPRGERLERLSEHDQLLRERLELVHELRRHAQLLDQYFAALASLAESDAPTVAGSAAAELGDSLVAVGGRVSHASLGGVRIGDLLRPVAELVVSRARSQALAAELRRRGPVISRELALEEAALMALGEQLRADLELEAQTRALEAVARPFAGDAPLPADWIDRRWEVLTAGIEDRQFESAAAAARRLREAFQGLVSGRLGQDDLQALADELRRVRDALRAID